MKDYFFLAVGIVVIIGSFYLFLQKPAPKQFQTPNNLQKESGNFITVGSERISVEIAESEEERAQGLSGRESLETRTGLLFVFPRPGTYGFWMKEMNFPIDIVWIDESWTVVGVDRAVSPETFPQVFYPARPVKYVLELNSGEAASLGIDTGSKLSFE